MKPQDSPKGQFPTTFKVAFNYEAVNSDKFVVTLPEGKVIGIKGKFFNHVHVLFKWDGERWTINPSFSTVKRTETLHDPTKPQLEEIFTVLNKDFRTFWKDDLFLSSKHKAYKRYLVLFSLQDERQKLEAINEANLNRIKEINIELTKYL